MVGRNVRPTLEKLIDPCLVAVRVASNVEVLCRPYFTTVIPTPIVSHVDSSWNRQKRRILQDYDTGKSKVSAMEPPSAKENILLLKGVSRVHSYYGHLEYVFMACDSSFWFLKGYKSYAIGVGHLPVYTGCCNGGKVSLPSFRYWPFPLKDLIKFDGGPFASRFVRLIRQYLLVLELIRVLMLVEVPMFSR